MLIDFGIAHLQDDVRHTVGGLVMGTPGYLSPELVEGAAITDATDWWGWAATITYAASGRPPFGRARMDAVLTRVRAGDVDLEGVDPRLVPLLRASLSPDPRLPPARRRGHRGARALRRRPRGDRADARAATRGTTDDRVERRPPATPRCVQHGSTAVLPPVTPAPRARPAPAVAPPPPAAVARPRPGGIRPRLGRRAGVGPTPGAAPRLRRAPRARAARTSSRLAGRLLARRRVGRGRGAAPREGDPRIGLPMRTGLLGPPSAWPGSVPSWRGRASPSSCSWCCRPRPRHRPLRHGARAAPLRLRASAQRRALSRSSRARGTSSSGVIATGVEPAPARGAWRSPASSRPRCSWPAPGARPRSRRADHARRRRRRSGLLMLWWGPGGCLAATGSRSIARRLVPAGLAAQIVSGLLAVFGVVAARGRLGHGRQPHVEPVHDEPVRTARAPERRRAWRPAGGIRSDGRRVRLVRCRMVEKQSSPQVTKRSRTRLVRRAERPVPSVLGGLASWVGRELQPFGSRGRFVVSGLHTNAPQLHMDTHQSVP